LNTLLRPITSVLFFGATLLYVGSINADDSAELLAQEITQLEKQQSVLSEQLSGIERKISRKRGELAGLLNALESLDSEKIPSVQASGAVAVATVTAGALVPTESVPVLRDNPSEPAAEKSSGSTVYYLRQLQPIYAHLKPTKSSPEVIVNESNRRYKILGKVKGFWKISDDRRTLYVLPNDRRYNRSLIIEKGDSEINRSYGG